MEGENKINEVSEWPENKFICYRYLKVSIRMGNLCLISYKENSLINFFFLGGGKKKKKIVLDFLNSSDGTVIFFVEGGL